MPTYFFHHVNTVITEDASSSSPSASSSSPTSVTTMMKDVDVNKNGDKINPIAIYDEELSKTFRKIQELLIVVMVCCDDDNDDDHDNDDDNILLLENLYVKAEYLLHMMGVYYKSIGNIEEKQQWKEIIRIRYETFDHLQQQQKQLPQQMCDNNTDSWKIKN